jgi:hypothetical protein
MHVNEVVEGVYQRLCIHYQDTPPEEKAPPMPAGL